MKCPFWAGVRNKASFDYMEKDPTIEDPLLAPNITYTFFLLGATTTNGKFISILKIVPR